jgi:hypothetical protein
MKIRTQLPEGKWLRLMSNGEGRRDLTSQVIWYDSTDNGSFCNPVVSPMTLVLRRAKSSDTRFLPQGEYRLEYSTYEELRGELSMVRSCHEGSIIGFAELPDGMVVVNLMDTAQYDRSKSLGCRWGGFLIVLPKETIDRYEWLDGVG